MNSFFRGWRRRTGLVLLLFTLELAALWVGSYWFTDWVFLGYPDVISQQGYISWNFSSGGYFDFSWDRLPFEKNAIRLIHYDNAIPYWMFTVPAMIVSLGLIFWVPRHRPVPPDAEASN